MAVATKFSRGAHTLFACLPLRSRSIEKIDVAETTQNFYLFKILRAHILPLTNCAFNKSGDRFITGSYDRTCKVWNTLTGEEMLTLEGHKNVVYAIAFNNPFGDKIVSSTLQHSSTARQQQQTHCRSPRLSSPLLQTVLSPLRFRTWQVTGSFDKTAKIWNSQTGNDAERCAGTDGDRLPQLRPARSDSSDGSMDSTAKLWDVERGQELCTLMGHTAEIVSLNFNTDGNQIITGSFDHTTKVWDVLCRAVPAYVGGPSRRDLFDAIRLLG